MGGKHLEGKASCSAILTKENKRENNLDKMK